MLRTSVLTLPFGKGTDFKEIIGRVGLNRTRDSEASNVMLFQIQVVHLDIYYRKSASLK